MTTIHSLAQQDAVAAAEMRRGALAHKGEPLDPTARAMFGAMLAAAPAALGVRVHAATVGGIAGFWCRPRHANPGARVLFLDGGGYVLGSARAFTPFAGQIAARAGAETFVPDYRLAPEHPFPAAIDDALGAYRGLVADGADRIVVAGDSAGGGLALSSILSADEAKEIPPPRGAAVLSPWTKLALSGARFSARATCGTPPPPRSRRISYRDELLLSAPRSMNPAAGSVGPSAAAVSGTAVLWRNRDRQP